jgi:hypothetical protein
VVKPRQHILARPRLHVQSVVLGHERIDPAELYPYGGPLLVVVAITGFGQQLKLVLAIALLLSLGLVALQLVPQREVVQLGDPARQCITLIPGYGVEVTAARIDRGCEPDR